METNGKKERSLDFNFNSRTIPDQNLGTDTHATRLLFAKFYSDKRLNGEATLFSVITNFAVNVTLVFGGPTFEPLASILSKRCSPI